MLDRDTFMSALYVFTDDFVQTQPSVSHYGLAPALRPSEVLTLLIFAQWHRFASTRDSYRYAQRELRGCFSTLPDRSQFVRQAERCYALLVDCLSFSFASLAAVLRATPVASTMLRCELRFSSNFSTCAHWAALRGAAGAKTACWRQ